MVGKRREETHPRKRFAPSASGNIDADAVSKLETLGQIFDWLGTDPAGNIDMIVNQTCSILGGVCALYNRLDDKKKSLIAWSACNLPPDFNSIDSAEGHICYEATILGQNRTIVLENLEETHYVETDANVSKYGLKAYLGHPVRARNEVIGSLCIVDTKPRRFTPTDIQIITTLAKAVSLEEERLQKVAESRVAEREAQYRALFENNHAVMLLIDPQTGEIADANPAACRYYGCTRAELIRKKITDINTLEPDEVFDEMRRARTERRNHFNFRHRLADGRVRDVEVYSGPITVRGRALLYSVIHDITERKKAEKALLESENLLSNVFESIQDGISILDKDLTIRRVNGIMKQWYAAQLPLEGKKCFACYQNRREPCNPCPTFRCLQSGLTECEIMPGPQGSAVDWVELYSYPIKDRNSGKISGVVEFVRDVSGQKRLETQLRQAERLESIGTLAGGIAHDFNNLLMGIQGRISLIMFDLNHDDPKYKHLLETEKIVKRASELTHQILGFARGGKYEVQVTDLNDLVEKSTEMFSRTNKEITIHKKYAENLWRVEADQVQLDQVLLNIYVNAWQAMPGGGNLFIQTENVFLDRPAVDPHGLKPGPYVRISVTDTGLGMDEDVQKRIFDPFFTTKEKERGTGLGLASAYGIIKNHGGLITVESRKGAGTAFNIFLPASDQKAAPRCDSGAVTELFNGSGTVLLVDDEVYIRDVGRQMLEKIGYTVETAGDGDDAVARFEAAPHRFTLVILDLIMPGLGGGAVYDRLREIKPEVKVLLSSGYSITGQAAEIIDRGCSGFIQKPFTMKSLSQKIREVLG